MLLGKAFKLFPEILVGKCPRFFQSSVAGPVVNPLAHTLDEILGVTEYMNLAAVIQGFQTLDRSDQLHSLRGRLRLITTQLFFVTCIAQHDTKSTGARVC